MASCLRLLEQLMRAAASRTFCTAGSSRPMRMAMIAITTKSSISVKPDLELRNRSMEAPLDTEERKNRNEDRRTSRCLADRSKGMRTGGTNGGEGWDSCESRHPGRA